MHIIRVDSVGVHYFFEGAPAGIVHVFGWDSITRISAIRYWTPPEETSYQPTTLEFDVDNGEYFPIHETDSVWEEAVRFVEDNCELAVEDLRDMLANITDNEGAVLVADLTAGGRNRM